MTAPFIVLNNMPSKNQGMILLTLAGLWLLNFYFLGAFSFLGLEPVAAADTAGKILGVGFALFATWYCFRILKRSNKERFRIDDDGIDLSGQGGPRIAWADVDRITVIPASNIFHRQANALAGTPSDVISVWTKSDDERGVIARGNRMMGFGDETLSVHGSNQTSSDLIAALKRYHSVEFKNPDSPSVA